MLTNRLASKNETQNEQVTARELRRREQAQKMTVAAARIALSQAFIRNDKGQKSGLLARIG
jgi:hypothetical protein